MKLAQRLVEETRAERQDLLSVALIERALRGDVTLDEYVAFLAQAYQHVRHTVPLLMAVGARLPEDKEWLREAVGEYVREEMGHQEWVLNDIAACGFDPQTARRKAPLPATELMVAYAWDTVNRRDPLGFFGMVHVLEGTSVSLAGAAADSLREALGLPRTAFSYLYSHGALDQDHLRFFAGLMNRIDAPQEQASILHAARMFYRLYAEVFRAIDAAHGLPRRVQELPVCG